MYYKCASVWKTWKIFLNLKFREMSKKINNFKNLFAELK